MAERYKLLVAALFWMLARLPAYLFPHYVMTLTSAWQALAACVWWM
jgi:hypothetical protein